MGRRGFSFKIYIYNIILWSIARLLPLNLLLDNYFWETRNIQYINPIFIMKNILSIVNEISRKK